MSSEKLANMHGKVLPLEALGSTISGNARIVSEYLSLHELPQPSFDSGGPTLVVPSNSPPHVQQARQKLIAASLEMLQLATGPREYLPNLATNFQYISCLSWLCGYKIFHLVPRNGAITYLELAAAAGVPEQRLKSILRMAMTNFLFHEQPDGKSVIHTATSALLAEDTGVSAYATHMCSKSAPMALKMTAAHQRWGAETLCKSETAYNLAFDTDVPFFDHISQDPRRTEEFARYMQSVRTSDGLDIKHLIAGFSWDTIPAGGVVVDVGGSTGTSAIALAETFTHLSFIIQDLPDNVLKGQSASQLLPKAIYSRLTFEAHDFKHPQPVQAADVYLLRMILHDWSDDDAAMILKNIIDAMQKGKSKLLIMDTVLPKPGSVPRSVERIARARDITMMQAFNSKEREIEDWKHLLTAVDMSAKVLAIVQPDGSAMSVLEVALS